jgi:hypothetical protein
MAAHVSKPMGVCSWLFLSPDFDSAKMEVFRFRGFDFKPEKPGFAARDLRTGNEIGDGDFPLR